MTPAVHDIQISPKYWAGAAEESRQQFARLKQRIEQDPKNFEAWTTLGALVWLDFHEVEIAAKILEQVISRDPQRVAAYFWLAKCYFHDWARSDFAIPYLEDALKIEPQNPECLSLLGSCYQDVYMPVKEYAQCYVKALHSAPDWPILRSMAVDALLDAGQRPTALKIAIKASQCKRVEPSTQDQIERYFEQVVTGRAGSRRLSLALAIRLVRRCIRHMLGLGKGSYTRWAVL